MRTCLFLIFIAGCSAGDIDALSITPDTTYISNIEQAASLTYGDHMIQVNGLAGDFKLKLANKSGQKLTNVEVIVTANNPNMISSVIFGRIYHGIFWGGSLFASPSPVTLPDDTPLSQYPGFFAFFDGDDLEPGAWVTFDSIVLGDSGLELHFQAYATLPDGKHYAFNDYDTSVLYSY